ncbi:hypothetical protein NE865_04950 [Phthorimaea operculella]|nr:hypothetical protein NE865_04950 [Phthorimaea operculella]
MKFLLISLAVIAVAVAGPTERFITPVLAGPAIVAMPVGAAPVVAGPAPIEGFPVNPIAVGPAPVQGVSPIAVGPAPVQGVSPIAVGPAPVQGVNPIAVGPDWVIVEGSDDSPISVGPAIVEGPVGPSPISVGPAIVEGPVGPSPISIAPALVDGFFPIAPAPVVEAPSPVVPAPAAPAQASSLVQIIVNVNAQNPEGVKPVSVHEPELVAPAPVAEVEQVVAPTPVAVVDGVAPVAPSPVSVIEGPAPVAPAPAVPAPVVLPTPVAPVVVEPVQVVNPVLPAPVSPIQVYRMTSSNSIHSLDKIRGEAILNIFFLRRVVRNELWLAGIAPPSSRRHAACSMEKAKQLNDSRHPLHNHELPQSCLKSGNSFMRQKYPVDEATKIRLEHWATLFPPDASQFVPGQSGSHLIDSGLV